jgi:3-hydroxyisobutyrate dehydrogenase
MAQIGFVGLGRMGLPMAANLVQAGHGVHAFDLSPEAMQAATKAGVHVCSAVKDAVSAAEFVISMVPTGRQVLEIFTGPDGVLSRMPAGSMVIDSSTIAVAEARALHEAGRELDIAVLDAPVSGGVMGAQAGTLTFMVGGAEADFNRARPVLAAMGRNLVYAGPAGTGRLRRSATISSPAYR